MPKKKKKQAQAGPKGDPPVVTGPGTQISGETPTPLRTYANFDTITKWTQVPGRKTESFHNYTTLELRQLSNPLGGGHRLLGVSSLYRNQPFSAEPVVEAGWVISSPLGCFVDGAGQLQTATHCTFIDGALATIARGKKQSLWTDLRGHRWNIDVPKGLEKVNYFAWVTDISGVSRIVSAFRSAKKFLEDATPVERPSSHQKGFRLYDLACSWVTCKATKQDMSALLLDVGVPAYWLVEDDDNDDQLWPCDPTIIVHRDEGEPEKFSVTREKIREFCRQLTSHRNATPISLDSVLAVATAAQRDIVERTLASLGITSLNASTLAYVYQISVKSAKSGRPAGKVELTEIPPVLVVAEADDIERIPKAGIKRGTSAFVVGTPAVAFKSLISEAFDSELRPYLDEEFFGATDEDSEELSIAPRLETVYLEGSEEVEIVDRVLHGKGALRIPRIAPGLSLSLHDNPYDTACRQLLSDLAQATPYRLYMVSTTANVPDHFDVTGGGGIKPRDMTHTAAGCYAELFEDAHVEHHRARSGQPIISYGVTIDDTSYRGWEPLVNSLLLREAITGIGPARAPSSVTSCAMRAQVGSLNIGLPRRFPPMPAGIRCLVDPVMAIYVETPANVCLGLPVSYVGGVGCCAIRLNPLRIESSHPIFAHPGSQVAAGRLVQRFFHVHEPSVVQLLPSVMQYTPGDPEENPSRNKLFLQLLARSIPECDQYRDFTERAFGTNHDDSLIGYLPGDLCSQYSGSTASGASVIETGNIADVYASAKPRRTASTLSNSDSIKKWLQLANKVQEEIALPAPKAPPPPDDTTPHRTLRERKVQSHAPPELKEPPDDHAQQGGSDPGLSAIAKSFQPKALEHVDEEEEPRSASPIPDPGDEKGPPPTIPIMAGPITVEGLEKLEIGDDDMVSEAILRSYVWVPPAQELALPPGEWTKKKLQEHLLGFGSSNTRPLATPAAQCFCEHLRVDAQDAPYDGDLTWLDGIANRTQFGDMFYRYTGADHDLHERIIPAGLTAMCPPDWRDDLQGWNFLVNVYDVGDALAFHHDDEDQVDESAGLWTFAAGDDRPWQLKRPAGNICLVDIPAGSWFCLYEPSLRGWGKHGVGSGSEKRISITARKLRTPTAASAGAATDFNFAGTAAGLSPALGVQLQAAFAGLADSIAAQKQAKVVFASLPGGSGGGAQQQGQNPGLGAIQAKAPLEMMALAEYAGADHTEELYRSNRLIAAARRMGIFTAIQALYSCVGCGYPHIRGTCPKNPDGTMTVRRTDLGSFRRRKPARGKKKPAVAVKM